MGQGGGQRAGGPKGAGGRGAPAEDAEAAEPAEEGPSKLVALDPAALLDRPPVVVRLRPGADRRVAGGHCWVFSNELSTPVASLPLGGAVDVLDARGRFLGRGTANPHSLIAVRILSRDPQDDVDSVAFYERRLRAAAAMRARLLPGRRSLRMVSSEGDGLPGLIVDQFEDVIAVQLGTLGMELRRERLEAALRSALGVRGAVLRNESPSRSLEGLPRGSERWFGEVPERVMLEEGGVRLFADVLGGQKTGFFFDQAENRAFARPRVAGERVLDVYANTGAWGLGALLHGASRCDFIEINAATAALILDNAALNGVADRANSIAGDARVVMEGLLAQNQRYGAVFLDPPAFAKTRAKAPVALRAYANINALAMRLVAPGGLLFSSSCSYHVQEDRFLEAVMAGARMAGRRLRVVRRGEQAPDHPVDPAVPETRYLKHLVLHLE
jgi:23S rRNA (cytosine1962-C5)-methyltransferase